MKDIIANRPVHDLCAVVPELSKKEYEELRQSIVDHGYDESRGSIITYEGKILDGRHRALICEELGIDPPVDSLDRQRWSPAQFVLSRIQAKGRILNAGQRGVIYARLVETDRSGADGNTPGKNTRGTIAKLANVNESYIKKGRTVIEASNELSSLVASGSCSLPGAYTIASKRRDKVGEFVERVKSGERPKEVEKDLLGVPEKSKVDKFIQSIAKDRAALEELVEKGKRQINLFDAPMKKKK